MPQYKFVAVQGDDGKLSKVSSSTRSHAVRAGLRKTKRRPRSKATTASSGSTESRQDVICGFGLSLKSVCPSCVDPFNSLPVPTNLQVDHLVKYHAADRSRAWFPYALQSVPMMHSTLAMAATQWRAECPSLEQSIQVEGLRQKGEAMREIGSRLAQDCSGYDDEMAFLMSTMATLAIVEVSDGSFDAAEIHLEGVQNLFSLRGGYGNLKDYFILCKSINIADILVATALGQGLIFPLMHTDQPQLPPIILEHPFDPPLHDSVPDASACCSRIFAKLRQLLLATQSLMISVDDLRTLLNIVDESILRHLYQNPVDQSDTSRRSRALVLAAQIFILHWAARTRVSGRAVVP
ncbi:uncharacterized protein NECHADRAFT_88180 [Fusarium vanettenii 77-13-4]|uniref:Uncharacterized protein n=1 Tax=Fusarium vanettenii (strain ATCC MYA-4622 / CBS 123669 / FGSC 9596 / NRRL 45880 / 77-13-4) TaxID=660122 RepID=C7ZDF3_FUSV7|nr:uncharacterized protein NECHADRAFT_88180 [Fusarium vanettenii 77-13-4]EEU37892.1 hypothetical protein NECHADRAFT_88180 [Fusarium vanettenii 77-13-4]